MWKRLNSNQMCKQFYYKEVFLIKRFLIERFYCIYIIELFTDNCIKKITITIIFYNDNNNNNLIDLS